MTSAEQHIHDVVVVGAGPAGLTTANLLAADGLDVLVLEAGEDILDYPRAVGIDDETLRTFQAAELVDALLPHTEPDTRSVLFDAHRRKMVSFAPKGRPYGWSRGSSFVQPFVDRVLLNGLERYEKVVVRFGTSFVGAVERGDHLKVKVKGGEQKYETLRARYLVGADGGSSAVRKSCNIAFDGKTSRKSFLVVDLADDPIGTPHATAICDPSRTVVSIKLPHGIRRLEFRIDEHEDAEKMSQGEGLQQLLALIVPTPAEVPIIRARVYKHHSRIAAVFRSRRVLLIGDAAHLMPVWQGQGYNNGIRDAANLAWKLSAVIRDIADDTLLDTYEIERRPHAEAMVKVSTYLGHVITTDKPWLARLRDSVMHGIRKFPPLNSYVNDAEFKPMPAYGQGALVRTSGSAAADAVGRLLPQPRVVTPEGRPLLDDVLGNGFAVLSWDVDPMRYADDTTHEFWNRMGARVVIVVPTQQLRIRAENSPEQLFVGDDGELRSWFSEINESVVAVRPDRFVAFATRPQGISEATASLRAAMHYRCSGANKACTSAEQSVHVVRVGGAQGIEKKFK